MKRTKLIHRSLPDYTRGEERFNMISHIVGGGISIVMAVALPIPWVLFCMDLVKKDGIFILSFICLSFSVVCYTVFPFCFTRYNSRQRKADDVICSHRRLFVFLAYFAMEATSAAKSSSRFCKPSPFSKRVNSATLSEPPKDLATSATYFSTVRLPSFTKACCNKQLFS